MVFLQDKNYEITSISYCITYSPNTAIVKFSSVRKTLKVLKMDPVLKKILFAMMLLLLFIPSASASCMGTVSVFTNPAYAQVYLDGSYQGETSPTHAFQLKGVPCGTHTVEVRKEGYQPYSEDVTVEAATGYKVSKKLIPLETPSTEITTETSTPEANTTATTPGMLSLTVFSGILVSILAVLIIKKK